MMSRSARYVLIGVYNAAAGFLIFYLVNFVLGHALHYLAILFLSYVVSITHAYIGQRLIVFRSTAHWFREYLRFFGVNLFAMGANALLLIIFVGCGIELILAQAVSVVLVTVLSYFGHQHFSFRSK